MPARVRHERSKGLQDKVSAAKRSWSRIMRGDRVRRRKVLGKDSGSTEGRPLLCMVVVWLRDDADKVPGP